MKVFGEINYQAALPRQHSILQKSSGFDTVDLGSHLSFATWLCGLKESFTLSGYQILYISNSINLDTSLSFKYNDIC